MTIAIYPSSVRGLTWPVMKTYEFKTQVNYAPNKFSVRSANDVNPTWHFTLVYEYLKNNPLDLVASLSPQTDYRYLEGFLLSNLGANVEFLFDDLSDDVMGLRPTPGGDISHPSIFKTSNYPIAEFYYPSGSYIVDNNATPHLQLVTVGGVSGSTVPTFSTSGGTTATGTMTVSDQGVFNGKLTQSLSVVQDATGNYYSPLQRTFGGQFSEDVRDLNTTVYPLSVWANGVLQTVGTNYSLSSAPGLAVPGSAYEGLYVTWIGGGPAAPVTVLCPFYFRVRVEDDQEDIEQFLAQLWTLGGTYSKNGSGLLKLVSSRTPNL